MSEITPTPEDVEAARLLYKTLNYGPIEDWEVFLNEGNVAWHRHIMAKALAQARQAGAADTARLDWLETFPVEVEVGQVIIDKSRSPNGRNAFGWRIQSRKAPMIEALTLREAIDAAIGRCNETV